MWKTINNKLDRSKDEVPDAILDNGQFVGSLKMLSSNEDWMHNPFFKDPVCNPIETLKKLIKRLETKFNFRTVTIRETYEVISIMSSTNTRGFDYVKSKTIKMISHIVSL